MQYMVGLQYTNRAFLEQILASAEHIYEVYFSFGSFPNGRSSALLHQELMPWELQNRQLEVLGILHTHGIRLNLLFNADCYGKDSQSRAFFTRIGDTIEYIREQFGLASVTTTSPLIAKFCKTNFPELEVRASVNMEIGTVQGMAYLASYFDSFYMQREYNRDFHKLNVLSGWCRENGKKLFLLANSGCLNHCSAHHFHDNLVAHEAEIMEMDNAYHFEGICREYLRTPQNYPSLITDTSFIRPEDIHRYEPYCEAVKLATRVHRRPEMVLESYIRQKYSGDILRLLEPEHSIYPYVLENGDPLKLIKLTNEQENILC